MELANRRYSVRKFSDRKVEIEKLKVLLEALRVSPTACNYQPQKVWVLDTSISATHIMLEAIELGLGSTFVGYFDEKLIKKTFHIPENIHVVCILPIGYPAEDTEVNQLHFEKKSMSEFVVNREWK